MRGGVKTMAKQIWGVYFSSDFQSSGTGITIVDGNLITGGTSSYYYIGEYSLDSNIISAKLHVKKFAPGKTILDEIISEYTLILTGTQDGELVLMEGYIEERPKVTISCRMKKLCEV